MEERTTAATQTIAAHIAGFTLLLLMASGFTSMFALWGRNPRTDRPGYCLDCRQLQSSPPAAQQVLRGEHDRGVIPSIPPYSRLIKGGHAGQIIYVGIRAARGSASPPQAHSALDR